MQRIRSTRMEAMGNRLPGVSRLPAYDSRAQKWSAQQPAANDLERAEYSMRYSFVGLARLCRRMKRLAGLHAMVSVPLLLETSCLLMQGLFHAGGGGGGPSSGGGGGGASS